MTKQTRPASPTPMPERPADDAPLAEKLQWLHVTYKTPPPEHIALLPKPTSKENAKGKCNVCDGWHGLPAVHLDYMGHAEVTDVLCFADPEWTWEPLGTTSEGLPVIQSNDKGSVMWMRLTIWGCSRIGVGTSTPKGPDTMKELIGDGIRNAAMRFGIGLDLWSKADGVDRKIEAGQHVEADSDHDPNAQPAPEDRPAPAQANGRASVPDVWTYDTLIAMPLRDLNKLCRDRDLPTSGKPEDYVGRLLEWAKANSTAMAPVDIPAGGEPPEANDDGEPATDERPADDAPADAAEEPVTAPTPDPEPDTSEGLDEIAPKEVTEAIRAEVASLKGPEARAFAEFKRTKGIPARANQWTYQHVEWIGDFIDRLRAPVTAAV